MDVKKGNDAMLSLASSLASLSSCGSSFQPDRTSHHQLYRHDKPFLSAPFISLARGDRRKDAYTYRRSPDAGYPCPNVPTCRPATMGVSSL
jgi:hypothetical protein